MGTFNIYINNFRENDRCLIYNTLSQGVAVLPLKNGRPDLQSLNDDEIAALEDMMIVVKSRTEERKVLQCWVNKVKYGQRSMAIVLFTTRHCNLACSYCYQRCKDVTSPKAHMTSEVAHGVVEWIKKYATSRGSRKIHLTFYGGEPLANTECIRIVGDALAEFVRELGIELRTYITTNGTLVDPDAVNLLTRYNLLQAQVTLDGPPVVHDSRRIKPDGSGSYREAIEGLKRLSEVTSVIVRCNVDEETIDRVPELLTLLAEQGLANKRNLFELSNTYDALSECSMVPLQPWIQKSSKILSAAKSMGFTLRNPCKVAPCYGIRDGSFSFDVDGSVYTCSQIAGYPEAQIGHIATQRLNERYYDFLLADTIKPECYSCSFLPICFGGCRAYVVHHGQPVDSFYCAREHFEETVPVVLRAVYE